MFRSILFLALTFVAAQSSAAPRCLDLTREQASKAVSLMKITLHSGAPIVIHSKRENGFVHPRGVWMEKKKGLSGPRSFRVRVDGREVDISLLYVTRDAQSREAWNLAWLAGCRPAADKPVTLRR